jgi:hypothetical protein
MVEACWEKFCNWRGNEVMGKEQSGITDNGCDTMAVWHGEVNCSDMRADFASTYREQC